MKFAIIIKLSIDYFLSYIYYSDWEDKIVRESATHIAQFCYSMIERALRCWF